MADILIGKRGDTLTGRVLTDPFRFRTAFGDHDFPRDQVWRIHIDVGHGAGPDEIHLKTADRLGGTLLDEAIRFRREGGGELTIPKDALHTIHLGLLFDRERKALADFE